MSIFDRLSERVGDFFDEVMLPDEIRALHEKARTAMRRGDYERALQWLAEAESRRPAVERTRHMRALCHFYLDDIDQAIVLFEEALQLREEPSTHFYLGLSFEKLSRFSDAQAHFQRALELDADPPFAFDLYFGLGRVYLAMDRPDKAVRETRRALIIWPDQREATVTLARALHLRGRSEEARELLHRSASPTSNRDFLLTLGRVESATGHHDAAVEAFERILDTHPDDLQALLGAARADLSIGRPANANPRLIRALGGTDDDCAQAEIFALIGATNADIGNLAKAAESYEAALLRDDQNIDARIGAARTSLAMEDFDGAAAHFKNLLQRGVAHIRGEAMLGLGRCLLALGDPAGAQHLIEEADHFYPERTPELYHALGLVARASDDAAEALVAFRRALHDDPTPALKAQLTAHIEQSLADLRPDWSLPSQFQSTADLVAALTELRDLLRLEPRLEAFIPRVHDLLNTVNSPLSVAVLGEFNAGKSTLINAILGEEVVPTGVLPTTAHPCIMGYGPRKGARVVYSDGRLQDVDFATAQRLMRDEAAAITRLEYTYPHPELRSLNYWDTPGFNALDNRHEELADSALHDAEAIIWIVDANQALKQSEIERLQQIPDSANRVLLVLNKIDRLGDPDTRGDAVIEIVDYLTEHAGDQVLDVLAISALESFQARTDDPKSHSGLDDFQRLMQLLDEYFGQRSWKIKISEVSRALVTLLHDIESLRASELAHFKDLLTQASGLQKLLTDAADDPQARAADLSHSMADRLDFVILGVEREIATALRPRGRLLRRLVLDDEDRNFIIELFHERLESVVEHHRHRLFQEISDIEARLAARISPLLSSLSVTDARPLRRRLEGFFDETRALKTLLDERVFGQWRARAEGQISTGTNAALDTIVELGPDADPEQRRDILSALIPDIDTRFRTSLADWRAEFFLAANRFCDRLYRDLATLELEARHRLDFTGSLPR